MSLVVGTRLGPYEIQSAIGAGGMGEVYKARDARLDRTVAIKVLPAELSADPDRRARFEREARAVASLNHPHICTLHDVGEHDGSTFLVMEHLPGQTLADRLLKGPLPLLQALDVAAQIAEALNAAHKHGIIHRDLKPGNVMLTSGGEGRSGVTTAKLLDFGLAKLARHGERPALVSETHAVTEAAPVTARGTIVGTLQYMAPEQLEGKEADARTDLWALGAILYEMVTGKRAFEGESQVSLIGNIMNADPAALASLQPLTPPSLERVVKKCLAKHPDDRWDTAHDVADELRWIARTGSAEPVPGAATFRRASRRWLALSTAFGVMLTLGVVGFMIGRAVAPRAESSAVPVRFSVVTNALAPRRSSEGSVAVSADGRIFVFGAGGEGDPGPLLMKRIEQDTVAPIPGTNGALSPFLSPDGRWVAFFREGKLLKAPIEGGPAQTVAAAPTGRGGAWRVDGIIFFAPTMSGPIFQVSAEGGAATAVTILDAKRGENSHRFPELTPDGDVLFFTIRTSTGFDDAQIGAMRLSTGERKVVLRGGVNAQYVSSGHLVFGRTTTLMAMPFDLHSLQSLGSPVPVLEGVDYRSLGGVCDYAVSDHGTLLYVPTSAQPAELTRMGRDGAVVAVATPRAPYRALSLSPDGRQAVLSVARGDHTELSIADLERGTVRALSRGNRDEYPVWSPDGAQIFFSSSRQAPMGLFRVPVDSSEAPSEVRATGQWRFLMSVTPDGRALLYGNYSPDTSWDLWVQPLDRESPARQLFGTPAAERHGRLSPDGRTLVFGSDESGRMELYVAAFPDLTHRTQISPSGGAEPTWSHSGRELFYRTEDALVAVRIDSAPTLRVGPTTVLFRTAFISGNEHIQSYDVLPDDRGFLVIRALGGTEKNSVNAVLNWSEELRAKTAADSGR